MWWLIAGCAPQAVLPGSVVHRGAAAPADLVAGPAHDVPTVIAVDFSDEGDAAWRVLYEDAYGIPRTVEARPGPGGRWRASLVGLRAEMDVAWTLERDGVEVASGTSRTGALPADLPTFEVEADDPDEPGWMAGVTSAGSSSVAWVVDRTGALSWFYVVRDPGVLAYQVTFDPGGDGAWVLVQDAFLAEDRGRLHRVGWDGRTRFTVPVGWAHHDLSVDAEGRLVVLTTEFRDDPKWGKVAGDAITRFDDRGIADTVVTAFDYLDPGPSPNTPFYPDAMDWSHGNNVEVVDARGTLWLSLAHLDTILEVDPEDGSLVEVFGGEAATMSFSPPDAGFEDQHGMNLTDAGTLLLMSTTSPPVESVVREYRIEEDFGRLTQLWSYGEGEGILSGFGGSARRRPDGRTVVTWGAPGLVREVDRGGTVTWEMSLPGESLWEVFPYESPPGTLEP